MEKILFVRPNCPEPPKEYNNGEKFEWLVGYELTGIPSARNNRKGSECGDVLTYQVKSPRATIHNDDKCSAYIFGVYGQPYYYIMSLAEFQAFVEKFGYSTVSSASHKKQAITKLKDYSSKMSLWLNLNLQVNRSGYKARPITKLQ